MTLINIKSVRTGDVLENDLYREDALVVKKGNSLSRNVISKLKEWGVTSVDVRQYDSQTPPADTKKHITPPHVLSLKQQFFQDLMSIGHEYRYGLALPDTKDYQWLEGLFVKFMSNSRVRQLMEHLRRVDEDTYQHSFDVFILGAMFARRRGLSDIENFALGCLLHDIGKLEIPSTILNKEAKLTASEYEEVKRHPLHGYQILKRHHFDEDIAVLARSHHERMDGSGYPDGLTAEAFTEALKLIHIADVYSALTLNRPYREAFGAASAVTMILRECPAIEDKYFYQFFSMLTIFPVKSIVKLTNGVQARVIGVSDEAPTFPKLQNLDSTSKVAIPLNRAIDIEHIIQLAPVSD
ncbi:HD-GYP domain-containing protein [Barrientosiimonas marina]|uniref:HD-GYP domain-containing protein n=1 Tax=Lentibacillus kimchii TaxID=1542911 RepID=A0ABW2UW84_9BACI